MLLDFRVKETENWIRFAERPRPPLWWILPYDLQVPPTPVPEQGFPLVVNFYPKVTIPFTIKLQNYIFNLNRSDNEARDRMAFQGYMDTWNTTGKVRDHYNAILNEGDPNDLPTWEAGGPVGIGANVVTGTPMISGGVAYTGLPAGMLVLKMEVMHPDELIEGANYESHPWLIHHLVTIVPSQLEGINRRNPFPSMGGRIIPPYLPSYKAMISPVPLYIPMIKLRYIPESDPIPDPYWPPEKWGVAP